MSTQTPSFSTPPSVAAQIARLPEIPMAEIRALWQKLVGGDTPTHNRQFLERRIAYRLRSWSSARSTPTCWIAISVASNLWSKPAR